MPLPLVSAIVTTYNSAATIERVLESIITQEGRGREFEIELIVVDDCSTDETRTLVAAYEAVRLLVNEVNSGGPNKGRNRGLKEARGDAICIVDHDDEWLPTRLRQQLPHLQRAPIATCGYTVVDAGGAPDQVRSKHCPEGVVAFRQNETFLARLQRAPSGQTTYLGTLLYSATLRHVRFEETYGAVDYDFIVRLFEGRASVEVCAPLYRRHVFGSNLSLVESYRLKDHRHTVAFLESYRENYPAEVTTGLKRVHGSLARYYYVTGEMAKARRWFRRAGLSPKHILYFLTTWGGSAWVKRRFNVFG